MDIATVGPMRIDYASPGQPATGHGRRFGGSAYAFPVGTPNASVCQRQGVGKVRSALPRLKREQRQIRPVLGREPGQGPRRAHRYE
jgi:hypothetical protein